MSKQRSPIMCYLDPEVRARVDAVVAALAKANPVGTMNLSVFMRQAIDDLLCECEDALKDQAEIAAVEAGKPVPIRERERAEIATA